MIALNEFGTYKIENEFDPHISVAIVPERNGKQALAVAEELIKTPQEVGVESIQITDIGHKNESWSVIATWLS